VVVIHNMESEAENTLLSLAARHQREIDAEDYEVLVMDNGSDPPFPEEKLRRFGSNFSLHHIKDAPPTPLGALNQGAALARGRYLGLMIDGARIVTPRILRYALRAFHAYPCPIVSSLAWHIGPAVHRVAVQKLGHTKRDEIQLLEKIGWPRDGYRLFEISTLAGSSRLGYFVPKGESSSLFLRKESFSAIGGYDERFQSPGGGFANFDFYRRACALPDAQLVLLLGEGSFHQMHDGAATGLTDPQARKEMLTAWQEEYERITQTSLGPPQVSADFIGHVPQQLLSVIKQSAEAALLSGSKIDS